MMYFGISLVLLILLFVINALLSTLMRVRLRREFKDKFEALTLAGKLAGPFARKGVSSYLLSSDIRELNDRALSTQGLILRWVTLLYAIAFLAAIVSFILDAVAHNQ